MSKATIWDNFAAAIGTEPREYPVIRGASGLDHRLLSLSVDDPGKRLVLISADPDPRIAAMMHVDVQATMPDTKVLVVRPIVVDLGVIARHLVSRIGKSEFRIGDIDAAVKAFSKLPKRKQEKYHKQYFEKILPPIEAVFRNVTLPTLSQIVSVITQAAHFDWGSLAQAVTAGSGDGSISLQPLLSLDNMATDREHGICPVPLYEFSGDDWELFLSGSNRDAIRDRLKSLDILQYFFPPPDQLALGLVDRGVTAPEAIERAVKLTPEVGHPLGHAELLGEDTDIPSLIDSLREKGLMVEGEFGMEVTKEGSTARAIVKFRPREGLVTKIINRITMNLSVSPKDFLK